MLSDRGTPLSSQRGVDTSIVDGYKESRARVALRVRRQAYQSLLSKAPSLARKGPHFYWTHNGLVGVYTMKRFERVQDGAVSYRWIHRCFAFVALVGGINLQGAVVVYINEASQ